MRKIIITIKYITGLEKFNYRIKKKDAGEASFIYWNKNKE